MLDPKFFQEAIGELESALKRRGVDPTLLEKLKNLSVERKSLIQETEGLKAQRNAVTQEIAKLKAAAKSDPSAAKQADEKVTAMRAVGDRIKQLDDKLKDHEAVLAELALGIPNLPHSSVPGGTSAEDNVEVRRWGTPAKPEFEPKDHVALGEGLKILDFDRATRMSGARFAVYAGAGARLERALIQFMLDLHTREHGYKEMITPVFSQSIGDDGHWPVA
jgi:seryl-tRNA synthetase